MASSLHYSHARVFIAAGIVTFTAVGRDALKHPMTGHMQGPFFKSRWMEIRLESP